MDKPTCASATYYIFCLALDEYEVWSLFYEFMVPVQPKIMKAWKLFQGYQIHFYDCFFMKTCPAETCVAGMAPFSTTFKAFGAKLDLAAARKKVMYFLSAG